MTPEVFIASVPWRRANLEELVKQTQVRTTVLLDGYESPPEVPSHVEIQNVTWGPGARWRLIASRPGILAIVIDDDFQIDKYYVERCVAAYERLKTPIAWAGFNKQNVYVKPESRSVYDVRLNMLAAGHAVVPSDLLQGLEKAPGAESYLSPGGHDEAFVSHFLKGPIWRPAGPSGLTTTKLHHDKRAQWRRDPTKYDRLRKRLVAADQAYARKVDDGSALVGAPIEHYTGARGTILEVRKDGGLRVHWPNGGADTWYFLSPGLPGLEPSVRLV